MTNEMAFPQTIQSANTGGVEVRGGLTKREEFTKAAMMGDLASSKDSGPFKSTTLLKDAAEGWVACADAALAALAVKNG